MSNEQSNHERFIPFDSVKNNTSYDDMDKPLNMGLGIKTIDSGFKKQVTITKEIEFS